MRFNTYLNSHFRAGGCRLLGARRDPHRERHVQVYAMPGYTDVVGLSDGTDAWVAPSTVVAAFSPDLAEQVRRLRDGVELLHPVINAKRPRERLEDEEDAPRPTKRARVEEEVEQPRRTRREALI